MPRRRRSAAAGARTVDGGRVVFLGTSLTAGLGLDPSQAYPALMQQKIDSAGLRFVAVNAGVSGETSAGRSGASTGCSASRRRCW